MLMVDKGGNDQQAVGSWVKKFWDYTERTEEWGKRTQHDIWHSDPEQIKPRGIFREKAPPPKKN